MADSPSDAKENGNGIGNRVNWQAARAYYLALPPERRSFRAVGERFHVTPQRVGQIARREGWDDSARRVADRVEQKAINEIVRGRVAEIVATVRSSVERKALMLEINDRAADLTLELLPFREDGTIDVEKLGDRAPTLDQLLRRIPGLFRMAELAAGEATDRVAIADVQPVLAAFARIAVLEAQPDRRADVMRLLEAASAGLVAIPAGAVA